jgi:hypothetical protein
MDPASCELLPLLLSGGGASGRGDRAVREEDAGVEPLDEDGMMLGDEECCGVGLHIHISL